jgi:hypothetical protein
MFHHLIGGLYTILVYLGNVCTVAGETEFLQSIRLIFFCSKLILTEELVYIENIMLV